MGDGTNKPIKDVAIGGPVANADPESSRLQVHLVAALHVTDNDTDFDDLTVSTPAGPKTITTTAHHLFWSATLHRWLDAAALKVGEQLTTPGDGRASVVANRQYTGANRT